MKYQSDVTTVIDVFFFRLIALHWDVHCLVHWCFSLMLSYFSSLSCLGIGWLMHQSNISLVIDELVSFIVLLFFVIFIVWFIDVSVWNFPVSLTYKATPGNYAQSACLLLVHLIYSPYNIVSTSSGSVLDTPFELSIPSGHRAFLN